MCMVCLNTNGARRPCRGMYSSQTLEMFDDLAREAAEDAATKRSITRVLKDKQFRKHIKKLLNSKKST